MAEAMLGLKRTHRCTEVTEANIGETVTVMGWVQRSRNKGGIIFTDLRDRSGILQIIFIRNSHIFYVIIVYRDPINLADSIRIRALIGDVCGIVQICYEPVAGSILVDDVQIRIAVYDISALVRIVCR